MPTSNDDISDKIGLNQKSSRSWLWIGVAALAIGAGGYFFLANGDAAGGSLTYSTEAVVRTDLDVAVSAVGSIEPTDLFDISSELSGTVSEVLVDYNDVVTKGSVLARLDATKLEAQLAVQQASVDNAAAKVELAEATLEEARENYEIGQQLIKRGVESETAFIAQEAAYRRAGADLKSAQASLHLAEANLKLVQVDLEKACICSPVDGVVLDRDIDPGQIVAASFSAPTLFTVAEDLTRMELRVDVDEADIGMVRVGQSASFTVDAYDARSFPAEIFQVRYASETVDGVVTYKAILSVENADMSLRPGMTASADITVASVDDALVVPNAALRYTPSSEKEEITAGGGGSGLVGMIMPSRADGEDAVQNVGKAVYILRNGAPVRVPVQVGESDGSVTEVISDNLSEGDLVVTDEFDG
ncbi:Macrolide export protein MacA [Aliiroseovarius pelagivivens]|uniref:Macrolide export protein MacA n=1 Tax=Aliiroseovarius pelagivivens TaxID=1639690 RepID=A0A2R8AMN8_9RHOB|nr:efflux RND transporter periplasmic adaptor subunit [Aliiroseovarius pelagivivens]SPF77119.1 Macrolide export protein MacA [Aliiroseovarius pelagivivens]